MSCWNGLEYCVNTSGDVGGGLAGSGGNWLSAVSGGLPGFGLQKESLGVSHGIAVSYLFIFCFARANVVGELRSGFG